MSCQLREQTVILDSLLRHPAQLREDIKKVRNIGVATHMNMEGQSIRREVYVSDRDGQLTLCRELRRPGNVIVVPPSKHQNGDVVLMAPEHYVTHVVSVRT